MSKEENINEVERAAKTVQITGRVSQAVKDEFEQLREAGGYETFSLFMEALLERYNNPLKINKENAAKIAELNETIDRLKERLDQRDKEHLEYISYNNELKQKVEAANAKCEELSKANMQQAGRLQELDGIEHKMDGHILVPVDDLDMRCLQYLADRENKARHRDDITPHVFFQYAVREMLIKGNKFAIDSVPDSIIAKFKAEIANGQ
jgi:DNA repair exonuclease SbcCD ATPase subunit